MTTVQHPTTETMTPDPDGVTVAFQTSVPYRLGTVSVWVNGRRKIASLDDGFTEGGGTTVLLKEAPLTGDTVQVEYDPE